MPIIRNPIRTSSEAERTISQAGSSSGSAASGSIEPEWLQAIAGKPLFNPAADRDTVPLVEAFSPYVREFRFNDLFYDTSTDALPAAPARFTVVDSNRPDAALRDQKPESRLAGNRAYRHLTPSVFVERLSDSETEIVIHRRRGFGQYALAEFPPGSIGVFVHRRDSIGESGSNLWFLANKHRDHEPLANLWNKLSERLADRAIIVSDGCLTDFKFLHAANRQEDLSQIPVKAIGGFEWRCIGRMTDGRGGLVWGLARQ